MHRGVAMRNPRHKPFWLGAEGDQWQGLWEKGTFKKWKADPICYPMIASLQADTFTRSNDPQEQGGHTCSSPHDVSHHRK